MSESSIAQAGRTNREIFLTMLNALGRKDFDTFESCLADDILLEWPYVVMPGFPTEERGARRFREMLEISLKDFAPYSYRIVDIYELADPTRLIAEYTSHSVYFPRNTPYSNRYISIFDFKDGRITRWREYVNPQIVIEALGHSSWEERRGPEIATAADHA